MKKMTKILTTKWSEGNKEQASDHETNQRAKNMVWTAPLTDGPLIFDNEVMDYLAYAEETGKSGYKHYQGFVCWKSARWTFACKKKYMCYFAKMKGTLIQNDDYCSKQGKLQEFGQLPKQGERTDLKEQVSLILEKKTSIKTILTENPHLYHQYGRTLEKAVSLSYPHRTQKPIVYWYYGTSGIGKTRSAVELSNSHYFKDTTTKWWDGYEQQQVIILDDLRRDDMALNTLLRLLDRYEYAGEIKGGHIPINSEYIVITSDEAPHHWWQGNDLEQIKRRCDKIIYLS